MLRRGVIYTGIVLLLFTSSTAGARETLNVLTWPGYADDDLVQAFEQRHNVDVEITYISNDDALWARLNAHGEKRFDVFAANTAELTRAVAGNRTLPLDLARIPNVQQQLPRFRNHTEIPGISLKGKPHAIPFTYSEMGIIYNRKLVTEVPTSINALWDSRYQGKVLAYDGSSHSFSLAAQAIGLADPFHIGTEDWTQVTRKLVELRRNVLTFYSQPDEVVDWFTKTQIALVFANYGSQQVKQLQDAGGDIGYVIPQEGALAWLDCWSILRDTAQPNLAHAWIDFMLEPAASQALVQRQGLNNTRDLPTANSGQDKLVWLQPVEDIHRRTTLWNSIRSGDSL